MYQPKTRGKIMNTRMPITAEFVSEGHPDKFCDQVADRILDKALELSSSLSEKKSIRTAIECLVKDNLLVVSGEVKIPPHVYAELDVTSLARQVWKDVGYGDNEEMLTVINHIRTQSPEIAGSDGKGTDFGGAGDQGIMVGYATDETEEMMPAEWVYAKNLILTLRDLRLSNELPWLRSDCKAQVTLNGEKEPTNIIIAAQHDKGVGYEEIVKGIMDKVVLPVVGNIDASKVKINGCGLFCIGGPTGDAGVVGRKIVVDAYGPQVSVGGGAYSGKDFSKVDRSAAYMARKIAKTVVANKVEGAKSCTVKIAYGIGQIQPEMVTAVTESGIDVSAWVKENFPDISPSYIVESMGLADPNNWSYYSSASYGHYGRNIFPWEQIGK
jgi:S-adenosylmethionine synthetase